MTHHFPQAVPARPAQNAGHQHQPRAEGSGFDRWLQTELSRLYDSALHEPVPEELLRLVAKAPLKDQ